MNSEIVFWYLAFYQILIISFFSLFSEFFPMKELVNIVTERDIIILDLDETPHTHPANDNLYKSVQQLSSSKKCKSVLLRSAIPRTVSNVSLNHNAIIQEADNSLLTAYSSLGFSAFGDYCGVKKDELTDGGIISPGYIKYS